MMPVVQTNPNQHNVMLTWTYAQGSVAAVGFNVYRGIAAGGPYVKQNAALIPIGTLTYMDANGIGGTIYFYVVTAQDAAGFESPYSGEISETFPSSPAAPTGLAGTVK